MDSLKAAIGGVVILAGLIVAAVFIADDKSGSLGDSYNTQGSRSAAQTTVTPEVTPNPMNNKHEITITTDKGDIVFQTYDGDAPKTVQNFIALAGKGFYDNVIFHRVIRGFMIQGGDPKGTGMGGPGYMFDDELDPASESARRGYQKGVVAMANSGPDTNGSQFFIMHEDYPLPHNYTIFGHVVRGQDVVDAIATTPTDPNTDRPLTPVRMTKVTVVPLP